MQINNIQTKFAIGDKVYFLHRNEIKNGKIYLIDVDITIFNGGRVIDVYYKIADKNNKFIGSFQEELLYENEVKLMTGRI